MNTRILSTTATHSFPKKQGKSWLPYANIDKTWYKLIAGSNNEHTYSQLKFSPKGVYEISKLLNIEFEEEDLNNLK